MAALTETVAAADVVVNEPRREAAGRPATCSCRQDHDLGWATDSIVDLGSIQSARGTEHYFLLFAALMQHEKSPNFNIRVVR